MKEFMIVIAFILIAIAACATPVSVIYGLHEWIITGLEIKYALWEAVKVWGSMLVLLIPGSLIFLICR